MDLRGRSVSQFLSAADMYKDLARELYKEIAELKKEIEKLTSEK